jgi:hypothetical protein
MQRLLHRNDDGRVNFDIQLLASENETITRARLRQAVEDLCADPARRGGKG